MKVLISGPSETCAHLNLDLALLRSRAERILEAEGHGESELSLSLIDDGAIAGLNVT